MGDRFLIYGLSECPFCITAVDHLSANNLEYIYFELDSDPEFLSEVKSFYNFQTVPVILKNCLTSGEVSFVGGCSDLMDLVA
tara:strand:- start:80 stop:325 length:246 start_codon:yes stop_codon:yes gene_type:complete